MKSSTWLAVLLVPLVLGSTLLSASAQTPEPPKPTASLVPAMPTPGLPTPSVVLTSTIAPTATLGSTITITSPLTPTQMLTATLAFATNYSTPGTQCMTAQAPYGQFSCQDGEQHAISLDKVNIAGFSTSSMASPMIFGDSIIQAQMRFIGQTGSFGLVFRTQPAANGNSRYIFRIRPTGQFQLVIWPPSKSGDIVLVPWTDSPAINKGESSNLLQAILQGTHLTLFANGQVLASIEDKTFLQGGAGFAATELGHAAVKYWQVWELSSPKASSAANATPTLAAGQSLTATVPSASPAASLKPTVLPTGTLALTVDFDPADPVWCEKGSGPWGQVQCQDGELRVTSQSGAHVFGVGGAFANFIMQAQFQSLSDSGSFGIAFRGQGNPKTYYVFGIRPTGQFQLIKAIPTQGRTTATVLPWTDSAAIKKGQVANLLQVISQGSQISLFANGVQLTSLTDSSLTDGTVGVGAYSQASHVAVSKLRVWTLP